MVTYRRKRVQTLGVNFINILCAHFAPIFMCQKITKLIVTREKLLNLLLYKICTGKMLMKLTKGFFLYNIYTLYTLAFAYFIVFIFILPQQHQQQNRNV